jgi:hypothetical protein
MMEGCPYTERNVFGRLSIYTLGGLEKNTRYEQLPIDVLGASTILTSDSEMTMHEETVEFATMPVQFCDAGKKFLP